MEGGKEGAAHLVSTVGRQPGALDGRCQKYERHLHRGFSPASDTYLLNIPFSFCQENNKLVVF